MDSNTLWWPRRFPCDWLWFDGFSPTATNVCEVEVGFERLPFIYHQHSRAAPRNNIEDSESTRLSRRTRIPFQQAILGNCLPSGTGIF